MKQVMDSTEQTILQINDFSLAFEEKNSQQTIFKKANLSIKSGEIIGLVGPSGSGKSVLARAIFNAWSFESVCQSGEIIYIENNKKRNLITKKRGANNDVYGKHISMVFQEPKLAFNPVIRVGRQIIEVAKKHLMLTEKEAYEEAVKTLSLLSLDHSFLKPFPHELSGGQLQRLMIAMAIISKPKLIIADEPTTSLDTVSQKQILELFKFLNQKRDMALLMITHNQAVLNFINAKTYQLENQALKPKQESLSAVPRAINRASLSQDLILSTSNLSFSYNPKNSVLNNISLSLNKGEILGIVGSSGSGKSTLAKVLSKLENGDSKIEPNFKIGDVQLIFQHPGSALDPSQKAISVITEALKIAGVKPKPERLKKANELLVKVGFPLDHSQKHPFQLSGGQKQRLCIARALCIKPKVLICDEPVSSLDAHLKNQIIDILIDLNTTQGLPIIFISHDIELVANICQRILVLEKGEIVEETSYQKLKNARSNALKELVNAQI
ncbi:MAG: ABC transporter ATP-binding protein [Bacteroidia bacterium]